MTVKHKLEVINKPILPAIMTNAKYLCLWCIQKKFIKTMSAANVIR